MRKHFATITKETALFGAGTFFVGSIITPVPGGLDTFGNNDGGTGAQQGLVYNMGFSSATTSTSGTGSISNAQYAYSGNVGDYATLAVNGNGSANTAQIHFTGIPGLLTNFSELKVFVVVTSTGTLPNSDAGLVLAFAPDGLNFFQFATLAGNVSIGSKTTYQYSIPLSPTLNPAVFSLLVNVTSDTSAGSGSYTAEIFQIGVQALA
jgi:hypothetical protein